MKIEYLADWNGETLKIRGRKQMYKDLSQANWPVVKVTFEKHKAKRSYRQNSYYWVCITILQEGINKLGNNFSTETVHEMMRAKFLQEDILLNEDGEFITRIKSTTELNKEQFAEYMDQITAWAAEYLHVTIPAPNTQTELL